MAIIIMVVEDEVIIGMDIRRTLKNLGYIVPAVIASGEKAIEKVAEIQPNLILMDIMLKGAIDGIETAKQIRTQFNLPVVYLTAHTDTKTLQRAKETRPFGYIVKPFEEKELQTTVEMAIARFKAESEIRNALEIEKELNELKSRFISMVSHEFRTPLSTILFSVGLLENYGSKWPEEKKLNHIHRIQSAVKKMTNLLEDVLTIGRAEAGKLEFKPIPLDLENFCRQLLEELEVTDEKKHQIILISSVTNWVELDEKLLQHILSNLLSNAIKYSPINSQIELEIKCENEWITFQVKDQGIGIPLEDQKHLFEDFHRAKNVGTISGTGLGLSIVKRSVELHGGQINVASQLGVGTTFTVIIPCQSSD